MRENDISKGPSFTRTTQHNTTRTSFDKNKGTKKTRMATHIHIHTRKAKMFIYIIAFPYHAGYSDEEERREERGGGGVRTDIDFYRLEVRNPRAEAA